MLSSFNAFIGYLMPVFQGILRHGGTDETHFARCHVQEWEELAMLRVLTFCLFCVVVGALGLSLWLGLVPALLWRLLVAESKQVQRFMRFPVGEQS